MKRQAKKQSLFSIGEMAKLFTINIRTLRYYDDLNLLKPEYVDPETNYRYYSTNQFERLNTIKYLRALDVSLARVSDFFKERNPDTLLEIFEEQKQDVKEKREQLEKVERKITNRINQIEQALSASYEEIVIKQIPKRRIVLVEKELTPHDDLEPLIRNLSKENFLDDAIFLGKVGVSIAHADLMKGAFKSFSAIFIIVEREDDARPKSSSLLAGRYVTLQYRGTHDEAAPHYARLMKYLREQGNEPRGDSVEITLIDAGMTNDRSKYVTELQIPF